MASLVIAQFINQIQHKFKMDQGNFQTPTKKPLKQKISELEQRSQRYAGSMQKIITSRKGIKRQQVDKKHNYAPKIYLIKQNSLQIDNPKNQDQMKINQDRWERLNKIMIRVQDKIAENQSLKKQRQEAEIRKQQQMVSLAEKQEYKRQLKIYSHRKVFQQQIKIDEIKKKLFNLQNSVSQEESYIYKAIYQKSVYQEIIQKKIEHLANLQQKRNQIQHQKQTLKIEGIELKSKITQKQKQKSELYILSRDARKILNGLKFEVSILKMQNSPYVRIGFEVYSQNQAEWKAKILESTQILPWSKGKMKILSSLDLKNYILIQLYFGWRRILNKLSFQSIGYRNLLCDSTCEKTIQNIENYILPPRKSNSSKIKNEIRSMIVFYSHIPNRYSHFIDNLSSLIKNSTNSILQITGFELIPVSQEVDQLIIHYDLLHEQKLKKIEIYKLAYISKEIILKYIKKQQKKDVAICLKIEIPVAMSNEIQKKKYQDIYDLIKRQK